MVVDDGTASHQEKHFPLLEQTTTHDEVFYVGPREKAQLMRSLLQRPGSRRLESLVTERSEEMGHRARMHDAGRSDACGIAQRRCGLAASQGPPAVGLTDACARRDQGGLRFMIDLTLFALTALLYATGAGFIRLCEWM
jgi:hypothetical protein